MKKGYGEQGGGGVVSLFLSGVEGREGGGEVGIFAGVRRVRCHAL